MNVSTVTAEAASETEAATVTVVEPSVDSAPVEAPVVAKPKRSRKPKQPKAEAPAESETNPAGWDETATGATDAAQPEPETEQADVDAAVAAVVEAPITSEPTSSPVVASEAPAPDGVTFEVAGLALDPVVTHETHRIVKVMTTEVKAACTLMFKPQPTDADASDASCADCYSMWQKALGTGDPGDPDAVKHAVELLRAGRVPIPSATDDTSREAFKEVVPVENRVVKLERPQVPDFDFAATLRAIVFGEGDVLRAHVDELRRLVDAGEVVLRSSVRAAAAPQPRAARAPREPRAPSSRPQSTVVRGASRKVQPNPVLGPDGKQLRKMWQVEAFGPFMIGENQNEWFVRDTRSNTDTAAFGRKAEGQAKARAYAEAEAAKLPQAEREAMAAGVLANRMVWDETRYVAR